MQPLRSRPTGALSGVARVPGDKSISHRALMLGALAVGETRIEGLLEGEDVLRTAAAMRALGASAVRDDDGTWRVQGRGIGSALLAPGLEACDRDGLPAYLETQKESNVSWYARAGFEVSDEVRLPGTPPIWCLRREPR